MHRLRGHGRPLRLELYAFAVFLVAVILVVWSNALTFYEQFVRGSWTASGVRATATH